MVPMKRLRCLQVLWEPMSMYNPFTNEALILGMAVQKCFSWFLWWMISTSNLSVNEIISERFNFSYLGTILTVSLPVFSLISPVPSFTNFGMLTFTSLFFCRRISSFKCSHFILMSLHTVLESGEHSHFRYFVSAFSKSALRKWYFVSLQSREVLLLTSEHADVFCKAHIYVSWCGTSDIKWF